LTSTIVLLSRVNKVINVLKQTNLLPLPIMNLSPVNVHSVMSKHFTLDTCLFSCMSLLHAYVSMKYSSNGNVETCR